MLKLTQGQLRTLKLIGGRRGASDTALKMFFDHTDKGREPAFPGYKPNTHPPEVKNKDYLEYCDLYSRFSFIEPVQQQMVSDFLGIEIAASKGKHAIKPVQGGWIGVGHWPLTNLMNGCYHWRRNYCSMLSERTIGGYLS